MSDTDNKRSEECSKSITPVANWIIEHVRPHVSWIPGDDEPDKNTFNDLSDSLEYAKEHIELGIKFKFKF